MSDPKDELRLYLTRGRDALLWKLDGLSDYDMRRPMTPTATNLLGLVKHVASVAVGYFGDTFGRHFGESVPWLDDGADPSLDLWVLPEESRDFIEGFWHRAWAHADRTIDELDLDTIGHVPWWPAERKEVTLHRVLIHMIAETDHHAGHADIIREYIDGARGLRPDSANLPDEDDAWWAAYRDKVERAARSAGGR